MRKDTNSGPTILLAEDDAQVRNLVSALLTRRGYEVLTAENGVEALSLLENTPDCVQLLLTDVMMPLMDGITLAKSTHRLRPEIKIVIMSGQVEEHSLQSTVLHAFLPKPFHPNALIETLESVLNQA